MSNNRTDFIVDTSVPSSCNSRDKVNAVQRTSQPATHRIIATSSSTTQKRDAMKGVVSSTTKKPKIEVVLEPSITVMDRAEKKKMHGPQRSPQLEQEFMQHQQPLQQQASDVVKLQSPSLISRYSCAGILIGICCIWGKYVFINENDIPNGQTVHIHSGLIPFSLTLLYVISLPLLHTLVKHYNIHNKVDVKLMLRESMIIYNAIQVVLNGWMVYRILYALVWNDHPFIAGPIHLVHTGAAYAVYVHYCDKYLEFLDTYFMILRGKMDQVRRGHRLCSIQDKVEFSHGDQLDLFISFPILSGAGIILTCVPSYIDRVRVVGRIKVTPWW